MVLGWKGIGAGLNPVPVPAQVFGALSTFSAA
jgi:hypothetical protein